MRSVGIPSLESNTAAIAAATPELSSAMVLDVGLHAVSPSIIAQAHALALLQRERKQELYRLHQHQLNRAKSGFVWA